MIASDDATGNYTGFSSFELGRWSNDYFNGNIDEVRVWNIALTASQISNIYNDEFSDPTTPASCLIAYYQLNESAGTSASDATGNGNTGTLTNMSGFEWTMSDAGVTPHSAPTCSELLPVELIAFDGRLINQEIELNWETASEVNNKGFEIQKSNNGRDWQIIDFVEGRGTISEINEYQFQDLNPITGINYYQLKQIDIDGAFEYSKVIAVEYSNLEKNIHVFPNPSSGLVNVQIDNLANQRLKVRVTDCLGKRVWESELIARETIWVKEINIEENGIYFINAEIGDDVFYKRVLINDKK